MKIRAMGASLQFDESVESTPRRQTEPLARVRPRRRSPIYAISILHTYNKKMNTYSMPSRGLASFKRVLLRAFLPRQHGRMNDTDLLSARLCAAKHKRPLRGAEIKIENFAQSAEILAVPHLQASGVRNE